MMNVDSTFFKNLYRDDVVYHYTKASTAIDFILYHNQLRFNKARMSIDPFESKKANRSTVYFGEEVGKRDSKSHYDDVNEIYKFVNDFEDSFSLVCFCQNYMGEDFQSEFYSSRFEGNEEIFGFTKLRMWDQYADKFSGVCIAFSKEKILSLNKNLILIEDNIKYLSFQELSLKKVGNIQGNHIKNVGKDKYKEQLEQLIKQSFFIKHIDYSGENEYRIGTFFDKTKCTVETFKDELIFDRTMTLDISGCIEAIFVSSYANNKQKDALLEYSEKLNVRIIEMQWQHNSFVVNDYKEWIEFVEEVKKK